MSVTALIPYRTIAGFCLIVSTGPMFSALFGLGAATDIASVGSSSLVLLGLLAALQVEARQYKHVSAASVLALLRTWLVLSIVVYVLNGHFGLSGIGARMMRHFQTFRLDRWWIDAIWLTVAIAAIDMLLGVLQFVAGRSAVGR